MNKQRLATICLMLGMFFNPFGFDAVQVMLINSTGSYWKANLVLYCLAGLCFGLYFLFSGNNPFSSIKKIISNLLVKRKRTSKIDNLLK